MHFLSCHFLFVFLHLLNKCLAGNIITSSKHCGLSLPLHAKIVLSTSTSCTWKCHDNYFVVSTTNPTCRKCTDLSSIAQTCSLGYHVQACTNFSDTRCVQCPLNSKIGIAETYAIPGNCDTTNCKPGYTKDMGFVQYGNPPCMACPVDNYCLGGNEDFSQSMKKKIKCPSNCSTLNKENVFSPLACSLAYPELGNHKVMKIETFIFASQNSISFVQVPMGGRCRKLDDFMYKIIEYGTFLKCTLESTNVPSFSKASCLIVISECYPTETYVHWLNEKIEKTFQDMLAPIIMECLVSKNAPKNTQQVQVNRPSVREESSVNGKEYRSVIKTYADELKDTEAPQKVPEVKTLGLSWTKNKSHLMNLIGFFFILFFLLFLGMVMACALALLQWKRGSILKKAFEDLEKQQKRNKK